jgi:urea transport system permease protein
MARSPLFGLTLRDYILLVAIAVIVTVLPALNLFAAEGGSFHAPTYIISLFGKYLCYALLAVSIDLVWGYCGILSLGHGAFFALGGYAMGMHLMREIGDRGVYGDPVLPDFMVFLNWSELPWYWHGFDQFLFAAFVSLLAPALFAGLIGWFAFRSRVTGVYLSIITQAMTYALMLAFFQNEFGFGGNNGLTDFKDLLGFDLQSDGMRIALLVASGLALAFGVIVSRLIVSRLTGNVMVAIRDAESRTRFLGYRTEKYKVFALAVSAALAGLAGALYTPQVGIINPGEFAPAKSIEAAIWVAVGGRGTLVGPVVGALSVNGLKSFFTGQFAELWLFALGLLFILSTLFLPRGIVGLFARAKKRPRKEDKAVPPTGKEAAA